MANGVKAFISYSHLDEHALTRFTKHLAMLRREGSILEWFDQKILGGGDIDAEISAHLEECQLFVPLVSADFLASNYCFEKELTRALVRHDEGTMRVVPVIIQDCDWTNSPLAKLKALPKDGKPVADWTNENNAWVDVITQLRRVIWELSPARPGTRGEASNASPTRASKYRVKRDFDEVDRMGFRDAAFAELRDYFQKAAAEVAEIEEIKSRFIRLGDDGFTCTIVNRALQRGTAHITVYCSAGKHSFGDITYTFQERAERGSANGWFSVVWDDYDLFLEHNNMMRGEEDKRLTPRAAAESLWEEFLSKAGIDNG